LEELAYINGVFCSLDQARVSVEDRGFQFADAIYEGLTTYGGKPFRLAQHLQRLHNSARAIGLNPPLTDEQIESIMAEGIRRCGFDEVHIYVQITRGAASRSHRFPPQVRPTVVMTFKHSIRVPAPQRAEGVKLITKPDNRWGACNVKSVMLLPNVLAKQEALDRGVFDTIFLGPGKVVYEATSSNIFVVRQGQVWTPRRHRKILPGITCDYIVESLSSLGFEGGERTVRLPDLYQAEEVFLAGTTTEVLGAVNIDGQPIGNGQVGPTTKLLYERLFANLSAG